MGIDWALAYLIAEWALRLLMLFYVPQRRSPAAARNWLMLILIQPFVGSFLYFLFGRAYLSKRRVEMLQRASRLIRMVSDDLFGPYCGRPKLSPGFDQAITLAEKLGDFCIVSGNEIQLLSNYEASINALIGDIHKATNHVHLLYYIFADDAIGRKVAGALADAVKRNVRCKVLVDSLGSKRALRRLVPDMKAAGIEVHEMLPFRLSRAWSRRMDLRNHRKIAVIDGQVAYVGSQNLVDATFKEGITYEEMVARVRGPVVHQFQIVFLTDRYFETEEHKRDTSNFPPPEKPGEVHCQALPSGPGYPVVNNQRLIVALIHAARHRIVITTPYFIPDEALLQALQTATLRGVEVHLIVSRKADQWLVGFAQRSYYEELLESGVKIHQYRAKFLHAKHLSVDDSVAMIGSSNMDIRSFQLNAEISLLVYDEEVAAALRHIQDRTMAAADLLTPEEWRKRSFFARFLQNMARLVDSVL